MICDVMMLLVASAAGIQSPGHAKLDLRRPETTDI